MLKSQDFVDEKLTIALKAARLGREVLNHYFGRLEQVEEKHLAGLVSEADKESERVIAQYLRSVDPDSEFLGEESAIDAFRKTPKGGLWIADPLDGTTNYVHRFSVFAVSLAYQLDGVTLVGVVDAPKMNEVFCAAKGKGAWINGKALKVSTSSSLNQSLLATGFVGDNEQVLQEQLRLFSDTVRKSRGIRRAGAAAYDLALVAQGVFDGFYEKGLKPWDSAAGILLVEEAGGKVTSYRGKSGNPFNKTVLATNGKIHQQMLDLFLKHLDPESD